MGAWIFPTARTLPGGSVASPSGLPQPVLSSGGADVPQPEGQVQQGGSCPTIYDVKLKTWSDAVAASVRHVVLSDAPTSGYYWRVLQIDAMDSDANAQALGFFLTPPGFQYNSGNLPVGSNAFWAAFANTIGLKAGEEKQSGSDLTTLSTTAGSIASPAYMAPIFVPPGWQIGVYELNAPVSAQAHNLTLRVLYVECRVEVPLTL
jgi:hypothetical protein